MKRNSKYKSFGLKIKKFNSNDLTFKKLTIKNWR